MDESSSSSLSPVSLPIEQEEITIPHDDFGVICMCPLAINRFREDHPGTTIFIGSLLVQQTEWGYGEYSLYSAS